jgi:hypothetical protein
VPVQERQHRTAILAEQRLSQTSGGSNCTSH